MTDETITFDPVEFAPNRVELGLDELGIRVREADWGDSAMETFLVRQSLGEIPADRHPPNRAPSFKLMVEENSEVSLAEAAQRLQQKVGIIQRESGFVRRDLDPTGGFAGPVAARVHSIALGGIHGWMMAHRQKAPDVTLSLVTDPYLYGVKEEESEVFAFSAGGYYLKWKLSKVIGSAPGLIRINLKNKGPEDFKGLISSMESRDHPQDETEDTTADLVYRAKDLTLKSGAYVSGETVDKGGLSSGFVQILNSKIAAYGHMTHIGPRRLWVRASAWFPDPEDIELRLEWRTLGASKWNVNSAVRLKIADNEFSKLDMGECRIEQAVLGEQRWEWRISARSRKGFGGVSLHLIFIHPTEQMLEITSPDSPQGADLQVAKTPEGFFNEQIEPENPDWANLSNLKESDNTYTVAETTKVETLSDALWIDVAGLAIPEEARVTGVVVAIERKQSSSNSADNVRDYSLRLAEGFGKLVGEEKAMEGSAGPFWTNSDLVCLYGSSDDDWGLGEKLTPAFLNKTGFGFRFQVGMSSHTGATLKAMIDHVEIIVYYTEAVDENRVCFASRSMELRSDGAFRQDITDDVWGRLVPDGFLPYAPPSGMEERTVRGLIVPSQGDHDIIPDVEGIEEPELAMEGQVKYFPGYHFTSEAS